MDATNAFTNSISASSTSQAKREELCQPKETSRSTLPLLVQVHSRQVTCGFVSAPKDVFTTEAPIRPTASRSSVAQASKQGVEAAGTTLNERTGLRSTANALNVQGSSTPGATSPHLLEGKSTPGLLRLQDHLWGGTQASGSCTGPRPDHWMSFCRLGVASSSRRPCHASPPAAPWERLPSVPSLGP